MPRCPSCKRTFQTLEDESDMHECPYCYYFPENKEEVNEDYYDSAPEHLENEDESE